jgi:hypothetical protein
MSDPSPSAEASAPERTTLTYRGILTLFLPLAATSTMMSVSTPIINAGLARLPHPETNLAAFGLAFALSILLESPVFALQQAIVAWYGGTGRIRPFLSFALGLGLIVMLFEAVIVFTPAAPFILQRLMGADHELTRPAVLALQVAILFPPLVALRNAFQAILIGRRSAGPIAWGTALRLVLLAGLVFLVAPRLGWVGPAAGMAALAAAVAVEMLFVAVVTGRTPEKEAVTSPAQEVGRSLGGRISFLAPLAWTMALGTLTNPLINSFIARSHDPKIGLAVYTVVASLIWFMASSVLRYSTVTIALGTTRANLRRLKSFLWLYVGGVCALVLLVTLTPAADVLLERVIGLSPELAARARFPLALLSLQPLIAGFIAYNQGVLTRFARTMAVGLGSMSRAAAIFGLGILGLVLGVRGGLLGGILLGAAFTAELTTLVLLRRALRARAART